MYSIQNLGVQFNGEDLFSKVSFLINEKDRIGLTGKNGAGKSTLLRVLSSQMNASLGEVIIPTGKTIGFLEQHIDLNSSKSIIDETLTAFVRQKELIAEVEHLSHEITHRTDYESVEYSKLIEKLNHANELLSIFDVSTMEADAHKVLKGLGFNEHRFNEPVSNLSGGWQMRIELAKILLQRPNLLLLDEPTNHLDIDSIEWLENFLVEYPGAVVLVSHDRAFLDAVTNRTIEISNKKIYDFKCSYSDYVEQREEIFNQQLATFTNQQKQIHDIERFVERFRYKASKSKQVQSRIKMLDKLDRVEVDEKDSSAIHFKFPPAPSSGKVVLEINHYSKKFGNHQVLKNINLAIIKEDFVAFVGKNGEGKTTLAKSIVNTLEYEGEIKNGHNVIIGYYAQNQAELLDEEKTVFETIDDIAVGDIRKKVKAILGGFLFSGEAIDKKVKVLSGGERSRLAIARLLLTPCNLLVLDEPTNHLDMQSKDILKSALLQYDGTLIIVSHDRDFLKGLTNKTYEFKDKQVKEHLGSIEEFLEKRRLIHLKELEISQKAQKIQSKDTSTNKQQYEDRKVQEKERRKAQKNVELSEEKIALLESQIADIDETMSNPEKHNINYSEAGLFIRYNELKIELEKEMLNWERLSYEVDLLSDSF